MVYDERAACAPTPPAVGAPATTNGARSEKSLPAWSPTCVQAATTAVHLLNVMGFRAEENPARRRRVPYAANPAASNGRRRVDDWYPIHDWTLAQVWERIAAGTRSHAAYAAGMSRLSCRFCVLSSRADLVCSARLNPDLADRYAEVERRIGHRFRPTSRWPT